MSITNVTETILDFINLIISTASNLWRFMTSPFIEFTIREGGIIANILEFISGGAFEPGLISINFLWFFTSSAIILLIGLKLFTLVNPFN